MNRAPISPNSFWNAEQPRQDAASPRRIRIAWFAAWAYVAAGALFQPRTLPWQLTHLASWPRTDTFGEVSFAVSFGSFLVYRGLGRALARSSTED